MVEKEKGFKINGKVICKESKEGIAGLTIEALDKDLIFDERLGSVTTDKEGNFEIKYDKRDFQKLFFEQKPDLYFRIKNSKGDVIYTTENKIRYGSSRTETVNINIPEKLIEKEVESERAQFKQLIAINPNYFGNIADEMLVAEYQPICPINQNVKYEELRCVGLYSDDDLLEAVIEVKLPFGFSGSLCNKGSKEFVAFYIDYNDGAGFVSVGAPAEVNVHDLSFVNGGHLFYAVRKPFTPKEYLECSTPQIVKVRAMLSWEKIPTGADHNPVWGNVIDAWVQIKPKKKGPVFYPISYYKFEHIEKPGIIKYIPEAKVKPLIGPFSAADKFMIVGDTKEIKALIDKSIEAEKRIKKEGKVEKERIEFKNLIIKNPNYFGSITKSKDKNEIIKTVYKLPPETIEDLLPKLAIDPEMLSPVKPIIQKTKYEELDCVGLYQEDDLMEAVIEIKLPYGYNGDLCTLGSKEYVAFYVDWGNGAGYQHIATSTVSVHDITDVNDKHLFYAVRAKIPNIESKLKTCSIENIVKVKAILSWNQDPTPLGHTYMPTWGNVLIRDIQIRPKDGASSKCNIEIVNEVHVDHISKSGSEEGLAIKENCADPLTYDRPFGGIIACWGNINIPDAVYYRFLYSDDNGVSWIPIKDKRRAINLLPWWSTYIERTPDNDGWFSKSEYDNDMTNYSLTALVHWRSYGKNGNYLLKLEVADSSKMLLSEDEVLIQLDNTGLELLEFSGTPVPLPAKGVVVKDKDGNYRKCDTFFGKEEIKIFGNFKDNYLKSFRLKVFGGNIDTSGKNIGSGRYDSGLPCIDDKGVIGAISGMSGLGQEIGTLDLCTIPQTPNKIKCAYGIELAIWDRAIVGRLRGYEFDIGCHGIDAFVTFNWDPVHLTDPSKSC